jgi:small subunit ribosomal protein S20
MANLKSSKKDIKRSRKRADVNKGVKTSLKTYVKKVRTAAETGDKEATQAALNMAMKHLDKAAQRGIIHKNQADRRKSRIAKVASGVA